MSGFKIRGIFNPDEDDYLTYVGIDNFDNIKKRYGLSDEYYFAAPVLEEDGSIRPNDKLYSGFGKDTSFQEDRNEGVPIVPYDAYSLPTPNMYLGLSQVLKKRGMVFNKKKCRFQVIKKGETT